MRRENITRDIFFGVLYINIKINVERESEKEEKERNYIVK